MGTRSIGRLSALKIKSLTGTGRHCDGGGLYLQVSSSGAKSWIFRYQMDGRVRDMGLGPALAIGLADARELAGRCRTQVARGVDPIEERLLAKRATLLEQASAVSFEECARSLIDAKRPSWRSTKHAAQWRSTLETYAFPYFGKLSVGAVDTGLVLKALEPIWLIKNETAGRVRERVEAVLDAARAKGLRQGDNPARWRGHLENLLARPSKVKKVTHHPALPYAKIGEFMVQLRARQSTSARAMEFLILTAPAPVKPLGPGGTNWT